MKKSTGENKKTVQDIIVERLLAKIEDSKRLPWQSPFASACMNWYSETEYRGINRLLLGAGEFITYKQLVEYNEKHKTNFRIEKDSLSDIVVFYTKRVRKCTDEEADEYENNGVPASLIFKVFKDKDGTWMRSTWVLRYYTVFNIDCIKDENGNTLEHKMGKTIFEEYTPAEEIIDKYLKGSGVQIKNDGNGSCFYRQADDICHMTETKYFESSEYYYRVLFHELTHSTGVPSRLNRSCYNAYHEAIKERSREELVAEVGSLLLATEAGFKNDYCDDNSDSYIQSWCTWMKDNPNELVTGVYQAEKAKNYILAGAVKSDDEGNESEVKIAKG